MAFETALQMKPQLRSVLGTDSMHRSSAMRRN